MLQANGLGGQSVPASSVVPDRKSLLTALQKLVQTQTAASGPDLSLGSKGQDVVAWQNQLNQWLRLTGSTQPQLTPDGTFGAATQTVTETLQTAQGLAPSGVVDTRTRQALTTALARSG